MVGAKIRREREGGREKKGGEFFDGFLSYIIIDVYVCVV